MKNLKAYILILLFTSACIESYGQVNSVLSGQDVKQNEQPVNDDNLLGGSATTDVLEVLESEEASEAEGIFFQKDNDWMLSFGGVFQGNRVLGEIGIMNGIAIESFYTAGLKMGTEISFNDNFYIAPKIGIELNLLFVSAKASLINYTDFKHYEPKLTPEIGLSILGYLNLTYGYNISLTSKHIANVPTHRITLSAVIPFFTHSLP